MKLQRMAEILPRYHTILLDAYGVLVNQAGAIDGAREFLQALEHARKPYFVLTNDASRSPTTLARRFAGFGLQVAPEQFITSGSLLPAAFAEYHLQGAPCMVFGPEDSMAYVREAGGVPIVAGADALDADVEVVVVCDDSGIEFLPAVEAALTVVMRRLDAGQATPMFLCNPDLIYPKGHNAYGITSGSVALLLEAALRVRHAEAERFVRLGKPFKPIFVAAQARARTRDLLMVGDQLGTDIAGARAFGIDSVLVCTGLTRWEVGVRLDPPPSYICLDLW